MGVKFENSLCSNSHPGSCQSLLTIARMAVDRGDEALFASMPHLFPAIEAAGARPFPLASGADIDFRQREQIWPELRALAPGEQRKFVMEKAFANPIPGQAETLRRIIADENPDLIVADSTFYGALPLLLDHTQPRLPIVSCGITIPMLDRPDNAPLFSGLPPTRDEAERARYATLKASTDAFLAPVQARANGMLEALGLPPLTHFFMQSTLWLSDAYLQPTVRDFEYDYDLLPSHMSFVGALPPPPSPDTVRPDWWDELEDGRRVVLVTQGTVANRDFANLIEPTLAALAGHDDLLVVATTGNQPIENVRGPIPKNARIARFLDYPALMPKVDLLVTNGGYGTVTLALQAGVPIVAAGRTEDRADIGARIAWSGVGLEIPADTPNVDQLRDAIERTLREPSFKERAQVMRSEFSSINTPETILNIFTELVAKHRAQAGDLDRTERQSKLATSLVSR